MQESGRYRMRTFSWRLNERIIVCSVPRNDGAEGSFGCMKMESVHPGHWEERTRDEVLVPVDDCIRWYDHERIKRSLGWMSPVQYRQRAREWLRDHLQENVRSPSAICDQSWHADSNGFQQYAG
ncbi:IS3 family transposase [Bifidobacterium pseudocatenulatum]